MNMSKRDLQLLTGLLGVLVAVGVFFLVYQPLTTKRDTIASDNQVLQAKIVELQDKVSNKELYISETDRMNKEMNAIYNLFPADVREEDAILLAGNMEVVAPLSVKSITIGTGQLIQAVNQTSDVSGNTAVAADPAAVSANTAVAAGPAVSLSKKSIGVTYGVSYEGFKRQIQYICQRTDRMTIETISATYDENTGLLTGATNVNMFYVTGPGRTYKEPMIPAVTIGTKNLFGTISSEEEVANQENQQDDQDEQDNQDEQDDQD